MLSRRLRGDDDADSDSDNSPKHQPYFNIGNWQSVRPVFACLSEQVSSILIHRPVLLFRVIVKNAIRVVLPAPAKRTQTPTTDACMKIVWLNDDTFCTCFCLTLSVWTSAMNCFSLRLSICFVLMVRCCCCRRRRSTTCVHRLSCFKYLISFHSGCALHSIVWGYVVSKALMPVPK